MFKTKRQVKKDFTEVRFNRAELNIVNLQLRVIELEEQVQDLQTKCGAMAELNKQMIDLIYNLVDDKLIKKEDKKCADTASL